MLQIKSFGTKEDCCQATQAERGYRSNQSDLKPDLRNGVAIVVFWRTHANTPPPPSRSVRQTQTDRGLLLEDDGQNVTKQHAEVCEAARGPG